MATIDTTQYANGPLSLTLSASDAASPANVSSPSTTLKVDNAPVTVSLTGPADAPSTAGTQYVTATAGPSGVSAIYCSLDGGAMTEHPGASAVDSRLRRYYRLTPLGSERLAEEAARLKSNAYVAMSRLDLTAGVSRT